MTSPSSAVVEAVDRGLSPLGFKKKAGPLRGFELDLADDVTGRVELQFATAHAPRGVILVEVVVNVTNWHISRIVAELLGESPRRLPRALIGTHLTSLIPGRGPTLWEIESESDRDFARATSAIVFGVETYGVPWMRELVPLDSFAEAVYAKPELNPGANYSRPVLRLLLEGREAALRELDLSIQRLSRGQYVPRAGEVERYVAGFRRFMDSNPAWQSL